MPSSEAKRFPAALTLSVDAQTWEQLEKAAQISHLPVEEWARALLEKALRNETKATRRIKGATAIQHERAPLDAFLPEGTDPFAPTQPSEQRAQLSFEDIQARMRFAGIPAVLRDW